MIAAADKKGTMKKKKKEARRTITDRAVATPLCALSAVASGGGCQMGKTGGVDDHDIRAGGRMGGGGGGGNATSCLARALFT